jgi:hypothetical protein
MSDKELEMGEEQLDEFKASMGDPSEVPEPVAKTAKAPGKSKKVEDDPQDSPTAVKPGVPQEASAGKGKTAKLPMGESKIAMIQAMVEKMNGMRKDELAASFAAMEEALEAEASEGEQIDEEETVDVVKAGLSITADQINVEEHVKALFGSDESLTEDFKEKATTIFEAAVVAKVNEELAKVVVDIETQLEEEKVAIEEEMSAKLDQYLDYVVEQWIEENKLAVEQGIKSELVEDFISGLKDLFVEHYIDIPDDKVDVVEEIAAKAEELEHKLDEQIRINAEMNKAIEEHVKEDLFDDIAESLTDTQKEKFRTLAEGVDFVNEDKYVEKLNVLKESYFNESSETKMVDSGFDDAEPLEEETQVRSIDPEMSAYMSAISRTVKK